MFLLLDKNRELVTSIEGHQGITASIRFSRPSPIEITLPETSYLIPLIDAGMFVYNDSTERLYLIEYFKQELTAGDVKAFILRGISIEGFWAQRVVPKDKEFIGNAVQDAITVLLNENVINPVDPKRRLDFYQVEASTDPIVHTSTIKTVVQSMSVMDAITAILESKNLGYSAKYNISTKMMTFRIEAGRNLSPGNASEQYGEPLVNSVLLSVQNGSVRDLRSYTDLSQYKTRIYIHNYEQLTVFDRDINLSGLDLREGYMRTSYGELGQDDYGYDGSFEEPEFPPYPEFELPELPPEIPVNAPPPEFKMLGMYVYTNKNRLLACSFYPGTIVPDIWIDVTPEDAPPLMIKSGQVMNKTGEFLIQSADFKTIYCARMTPGWLGSRFFTRAEKLVEARLFDLSASAFPPEKEYHIEDNIVGSFALDWVTGEVKAVVTSKWISGEAASHEYWHYLLGGDVNGVSLEGGPYKAIGAYPNNAGVVPTMSYSNGRLMHSQTGIFFVRSEVCVFTPGSEFGWIERLDSMVPEIGNNVHFEWHIRPNPQSDVTYFGCRDTGYALPVIYRSMDALNGTSYQVWNPPDMLLGQAYNISFTADGLKAINRNENWYEDHVYMINFDPTDVSGSSYVRYTPTAKEGGATLSNIVRAVWCGLNDTGQNVWGIMTRTRQGGYPECKTAFYITTNDNLTECENVTPLMQEFFELGEFGVDEGGVPNEYPVMCWPILG